jgi:hypothetical protein
MKNWTEKAVRVDVPVVDFVRGSYYILKNEYSLDFVLGPSSEQLAKNILSKFYDKFGKPKAEVTSEGTEAAKNVGGGLTGENQVFFVGFFLD